MMTRLNRLFALGAATLVLLLFAGRDIDSQRLLAGSSKGDWATYVSMSLSIANDFDLRYEKVDLDRFVSLFPEGPKGIFLKERFAVDLGGRHPVPAYGSLSFGKAFLYPALAAPFVYLGGIWGLFVFNGFLLLAILLCVTVFGWAVGQLKGVVFAAAFVMASAIPVYVAWLGPELLNVALVTAAYGAWLYKKLRPEPTSSWLCGPWSTPVAALLLGVVTYSKPTHALLFAPLLLDTILQRRAFAVGLTLGCFALGSAGLFGANAVLTGEWSYQGALRPGGRRSFDGRYPFDARGTTFEAGQSMVTNDFDTERVLAPDARGQVLDNLAFFVVGRHAGLVPYYFPGCVSVLILLRHTRRTASWHWSTLLAVVASAGGLLVFAPDSWNGGGGPPGNRYFISIYAPLLFIVPAVPSWIASGASVMIGGAFVSAMVAHPFQTNLAPWEAPTRAPLRWLPIELTLLNDLPCRLQPLPCPEMFIGEPSVQLYYFSSHPYQKEGDGIWVPGGELWESVVKMDRRPRYVRLTFSSPISNAVTGTFDSKAIDVDLLPGTPHTAQLSVGPGFRYHQNVVYLMRLRVEKPFMPAEIEPGAHDRRKLGVFMRLQFFY